MDNCLAKVCLTRENLFEIPFHWYAWGPRKKQKRELSKMNLGSN